MKLTGFFLPSMLATIIAPLLFNTFASLICQNNSLESSPVMPEEFGEHLTRDQRPFLLA